MILEPRKARLILAGRATQHRRQTPITARAGTDIPIRPGHDRPMIGRARIEHIEDQRLGDITYHDARAEGHRTTDDFRADWVARHDQRWIADRDLDDEALVDRFHARWADTIVSVITLRPVADQPRFLASQYDILHGHTNEGEFTTQRGKAIDDLEVVDDQTMDRYARQAESFGVAQREAAQAVLADKQQAKRNERLAMFKQRDA